MSQLQHQYFILGRPETESLSTLLRQLPLSIQTTHVIAACNELISARSLQATKERSLPVPDRGWVASLALKASALDHYPRQRTETRSNTSSSLSVFA